MACLWAKDPPKFEDLIPPDQDSPAEAEDDPMPWKTDLVMAQFGGVMPTDRPKAQAPAEDEFTRKMWRLMGVTS